MSIANFEKYLERGRRALDRYAATDDPVIVED
jgi:hypothetical protein